MSPDREEVRRATESVDARTAESLREDLVAHYGSASETLRLAGRDVDQGIDSLAEDLGVDVEQLVPVLVTLSIACEPRFLERRWLGLGGFDWLLLLAAIGLLALALRALLILL